jgi:3-deoxy-D-manno-octulosonic-acid transferase
MIAVCSILEDPPAAVEPAPLPPFFHACRAAYTAAWALALPGLLAYRLLRRRPGTSELLGRVPRRPRSATRSIWIHAVSVGELFSARPVLRELKCQRPDWWVLLTTTSPEAYRLARANSEGADAVSLLPWDFAPFVRSALQRAEPDLLVLVECELWPNLITHAVRMGAAVAMINARIYENDLPRYRWAHRFFGPLLNQVAFIGAQSTTDAERFRILGANQERVACVGNTKFDVPLPADLPARLNRLRRLLPLSRGPIWVLASTHDGEERAIFARLGPLRQRFPGLQLVVAPRHPGRAEAVRREAEGCGMRTTLRSTLSTQCSAPDVLILDTVGELPLVLGLADLVFIGGSLADRGGHNPIEAARHGKAILIGPSVRNFAEIVAAFQTANALVLVNDADDLVTRAGELLADAYQRAAFGERALQVVTENEGAALTYAGELERLANRGKTLAGSVR